MQTPPDSFDPVIGSCVLLSPGVRRILAPNPSPMTYRGTNTYLVGDTELAVIDPGPVSQDHLEAILSAVPSGACISHIIVTHTHLDHSPLARPLAQETGAPVLAFGTATAGRSAIMEDLALGGLAGGGEGVDVDFVPDQIVRDGDIIEGTDWRLEVIHTPGHIGNHIALAWNDLCFTADHVMGWASSLVSPPDGDLTDFMESCRRLQTRQWSIFHPGHGAPIEDPDARLNWLITHRQSREAAIIDVLRKGPRTARTLAETIYTDTPAALLPAAERNVFAHLIDLYGKKMVTPLGSLSAAATFELL